jgi:hypothetical protein
MAPKIQAERVRWSCGALGLVPRRAHRRVILFFWPIRASSWNQISIGWPAASRSAIASRLAAKFYGMARPCFPTA